MAGTIGYQFKAWGNCPLPRDIDWAGHNYRLQCIFKHDFFAATALYVLNSVSGKSSVSVPLRIVLKLSRRTDFVGLPLCWLGRMITRHELLMLRLLQGIGGVPRLLGSLGKFGLLYEYIEGRSLDEISAQPRTLRRAPDHFFDKLQQLLEQIHARHVAYVDMNKRGNILIGRDNAPYIIDFQISCRLYSSRWPWRVFARLALDLLQKEDLYHLMKHRKHFQAVSPEYFSVYQISPLIAWHRRFARPLIKLRRRVLAFLFHKNLLINDDIDRTHPESDPSRWSR